MKMKLKRQRGFTLMEVMITVAIIGILAAIAFPSYQDSLRKSRRTDGKNMLSQAAANMERYYSENNGYCTTANCGTMTVCNTTPTICPGTCTGGVCTSTEGNYLLTFDGTGTRTLSATQFMLLATPTGAQPAADGIMRIIETGRKSHDANNDGDYVDAGEDNWK